jgi:glycosyltransferase involved in cell wall biosynthesis
VTVQDPPRLVEATKAFYLGGTETQLLALLRGLRGWEVRTAVVWREGPLLEQVRALGHEPEEFPLGDSALRWRTARQIVRMARWFRRQRARLVHVHDFYATLLAVPAARLAGIPVVVSRLDQLHWPRPAQRLALVSLTRLAAHVVVNAEAVAEQLVRAEHLPPGQVTVVHNGLDLARFDAAVSAGLQAPLPEDDRPAIALVANMNHPVKRQEDALEAIALLARRGIEAQLWLVGDGPLRPSLELRATALGVRDRAHFLGHRLDVPAVLARARVALSCSSAEGLSNAIMESMAAGLPVVATAVGGSPELVEDGATGRLVPPAAPPALAEALAELLLKQGLARQSGRAGRKVIARDFSLERMVAGLDAVYRQVLGRAAG